MDRKQQFINLRNRKFTYQEIANNFGLSRQRVHQIITGYKSPIPKHILDEREKRRLIKSEYISKITKDKFKNRMTIFKLTGIRGGSRDRIRELIRIRDNHTCQICNKVWEKGKRRFDVHHTNPEFEGKTFKLSVQDGDRNNIKEMITLCHKCHLGLPHNREKMKKRKQGINTLLTRH